MFWVADEYLTPRLPIESTKKSIEHAVQMLPQNENSGDPFISMLKKTGLFINGDTVFYEHTKNRESSNFHYFIFIHTFLGGEINRVLQFALEGYLHQMGIQGEVFSNSRQVVVITFEHIELSLSEVYGQFSSFVYSSVENSGFFGVKFREITNRFLVLSSAGFGKRRPLWLNRAKVKQFYTKIKAYKDNPVIKETWREIIEDTLDLDSARDFLARIQNGQIHESRVYTEVPSLLCDEAVFRLTDSLMYKDDTPLPDNRSSVSLEYFLRVSKKSGGRLLISKNLLEDFEKRLQSRTQEYVPDSPSKLLRYITERIIIPRSEYKDIIELYNIAEMREDIGAGVYSVESDAINGITTESGIRILMKLFGLSLEELRPEHIGSESAPDLHKKTLRESPDEMLFMKYILSYYGPVSIERLLSLYGFDAGWLSACINNLLYTDNEQVLKGRFIEDEDNEQVVLFENMERLLSYSNRPSDIFKCGVDQYQRSLTARYLSCDTEEEFLKMIIHFPFKPLDFLSIICRLRFDNPTHTLLNGLLQSRILIVKIVNGSLILYDTSGLDRIGSDKKKSNLVFPSGSWTFWEMKDKSGLASKELLMQLKKEFLQGLITCDNLDGIAGLLTLNESHIAKETKIGYHSWKQSRVLPGNWFAVPDYDAPDEESIEGIEYEKSKIRLLLDRYGIITKDILLRESKEYRLSELKRGLRLMELSGEIVSGYFIEEFIGRQFMHPSFPKEFDGLEKNAVKGIVYCREPALLQNSLFGNSLFFIAVDLNRPPLAYFPKQKKLVGLTAENIGNIDLFLRSPVIDELHIEEVDGIPVNESDKLELLRDAGGVQTRRALRFDQFSLKKR